MSRTTLVVSVRPLAYLAAAVLLASCTADQRRDRAACAVPAPAAAPEQPAEVCTIDPVTGETHCGIPDCGQRRDPLALPETPVPPPAPPPKPAVPTGPPWWWAPLCTGAAVLGFVLVLKLVGSMFLLAVRGVWHSLCRFGNLLVPPRRPPSCPTASPAPASSSSHSPLAARVSPSS